MFIGTAHAAGPEDGLTAIFSPFGVDIVGQTLTMWGVVAFLAVVSYMATKNMQLYPTGLQNAMEKTVEMLIDLFAGVMGVEKAKKYLPFLGTMFLLILASNYVGLLPLAGKLSFFQAPTNALSVTIGLALCTFTATHYYGIKEKGLKYFKHFIEPYPFFLPLTILEELVKPLSLSLRLFGNIYGKEILVYVLFSLMPFILPLPAYFLKLLLGAVQALVFTLLSAIYISMATADHH